ncbi:hypothetical protein HWV62_7453 [Athelia sp. TMB]|nr:hypothetical protein HWV62_7453 [Athelia sp. TMB]
MLRSVICQLSHQSAGIPLPLMEIYGGGHQQPSVASLQLTFEKIVDGFEHVYLVLDALDECTDREKLLAWIDEIFRWKCGNVHVLLSSRLEADIEERFGCLDILSRVSLSGSSADTDITNYLDAMLSKMVRWDAQTRVRVRSVLLEGADGMFRWVALHVEELAKCHSRRSVEVQLRSLPKDLDGVYERILLRSNNQHDLKQFLLWLAFSQRVLTVEELTDVITVDLSSGDLPWYEEDLRYFGPTDMLVTCSGFVTTSQGDSLANFALSCILTRWCAGAVKLAHMSVKEYLLSTRIKDGMVSFFSIDERLAHSAIAATCLSYILHLGGLLSVNTSTLEPFPLALYAAQYWTLHMKLGRGVESPVWQLMVRLFSQDGNALANWIRLEDPDSVVDWDRVDYEKSSSDIAPPLYYASCFGIEELAVELLRVGADVHAQGGLHEYALIAASYHGQSRVAQILLEHGAHVNAHGEGDSALQVASGEGHTDVVKVLLQNGADVNAPGGRTGTALRVASANGRVAVVRLLLEHGANINALGKRSGTALQSASTRGQEAVVRLLLEHGADTNAPGWRNGPALQSASFAGKEKIVRLLLENGADVNAGGGINGTALQSASFKGFLDIIRLLIEHGADVNARGGKLGTAIQAALIRGRVAVAQLLLQNGAVMGSQGGEALQRAIKVDHEGVAQVLLDSRVVEEESGSNLATVDYDNFNDDKEANENGHNESEEEYSDAGTSGDDKKDSDTEWYSAEDISSIRT